MEEEDEENFGELIGINEKDEKKIKLSIDKALKNTESIPEAILFLCKKNRMDVKSVFAGFCTGIATTMALVEVGKIPVVIPVAIPMPVPMSVNIPNDDIAG